MARKTGNNEKERRCSVSQDEEKPPVFSSWNKLYALVLLNLALLITVFYLFTKAFE